MRATPTQPAFAALPQAEPQPSRSAALAFWATACVLSFWSLGARDLWKSEARWGEVTREMLLTGDYFHPKINGEPYFDKPLLGYWLIAATAKLTGGLNEWAVRFPSAIAGLIALAATISLGRRLWSEEVARTAGWLLLTTYGFIFYARLGMADMENLAAIALAAAWYAARREKRNFVTYVVFYLICAVGAQTKGLTAIVIPPLVILPDVWRDGWRGIRAQLNFAHAAAAAVGAAVYLLPFAYSSRTGDGYGASGLALVFQENIQRFKNAFDHDEPWYVYFYHLPTLFLPWTPMLLLAFVECMRSFRHLDAPTRWMAWSIVLIFAFFSASESRRIYYLLPILPFCALLTGAWVCRSTNERVTIAGLALQRGIAIAACVLSIASLLAWRLAKARLDFDAPRALVFATPIIGALALPPLLWPTLRGRPMVRWLGFNTRLAPTALGVAVLLAGFFGVQYKTFDAFREERSFAAQVRDLLQASRPAQLAYYHRIPETLIYYMNQPAPLRRLYNTETMRAFLDERGTRIFITQREYLKRLHRMGVPDAVLDHPLIREHAAPWRTDDPDLLIACVIRP